jgi:hypothetical protein
MRGLGRNPEDVAMEHAVEMSKETWIELIVPLRSLLKKRCFGVPFCVRGLF